MKNMRKNTTASHISEIQELTLQAIKLRKQIADKILSLPDNPRITRLGNNCFTVQSSAFLNGPWNVAYHDFKQQYKAINKELTKAPIEDTLKVLNRIINTGYVRETSTYRFRLHPDVIQHLNKLLGGKD